MSIDNIEQARAIGARARVVKTPVGDGFMVWHVWGPPTGKPLILLHGGSGSWNHWVRNVEFLAARGFHVIVADMPSFGDSARVPHGEDADALPPHLELGASLMLGRQRATVVGFSCGSLTAGLWMKQSPERFAGIVFVGGPSLTERSQVRVKMESWYHVPPGPERERIIAANLRALMIGRDDNVHEFSLALHTENLLRDRMRKRRMSVHPWLVDVVPKIEVPVAGIYGVLDAAFPDNRLDGIEASLRRAPLFHSMTRIHDVGHWVQFEDAPAFNAALAHFLDTAALKW